MGIGERLKVDVQALIDGYKPAILSDRRGLKIYDDLKREFPYISPFVKSEPDSVIFFQTNDLLDKYQKRVQNVEESSPEFEYVVGVSLGFPKRSARWFSDMTKEQEEKGLEDLPPERELQGVGVYWAGFTFVSNVKWMDEDIRWMWSTYNHIKATENPLFLRIREKGFLEISFDNLHEVKKIQEDILKDLELVPTVSNK